LECLEGFLDGCALDKDLTVETGQHFANEDLVHKVGCFYVVEKVEKLLVVRMEDEKDEPALQVGRHLPVEVLLEFERLDHTVDIRLLDELHRVVIDYRLHRAVVPSTVNTL
jgi:hypothetical protein